MQTSEFDSDRTWKIEISSPAEIMACCQLIHTGPFYSRGSQDGTSRDGTVLVPAVQEDVRGREIPGLGIRPGRGRPAEVCFIQRLIFNIFKFNTLSDSIKSTDSFLKRFTIKLRFPTYNLCWGGYTRKTRTRARAC